jgi:hypothetical protein
MVVIRINYKSHRGDAPNAMSTFSRKKYQKLAPEKSPGVSLQRYLVRFFNSALRASDTKNLFTLVPRRSTEIFLMGQNQRHQKKWIPAFAGMTGYTQGPVAPPTGNTHSLKGH